METQTVVPGPGEAWAGREPARDAHALFERAVPELGRFGLRKLRMPDDLATIHDWVSRDYAAYWGLTGRSREEVSAVYRELAARCDLYLGLCDGQPAFLAEAYDPRTDAIAEHYAVEPGDRGMHILVGPPERPRPGFTWACFATVMDFLFADPSVQRIVVEPDIRNSKIHALNRRAGFRYQKAIALPHKTAHLAFCTRAQYRAACEPAHDRKPAPAALLQHLRPEVWEVVNRGLIRKAIGELAHELLLAPKPEGGAGTWQSFVLSPEGSPVQYRFRARILALEHWDIAADSLEKTVHGRPAALDALSFFIEFAAELQMQEAILPVYLEEIASTLYAAAYKREHETLSAADLVHASFQELEAAMTEGHPVFVANSGRVGFDVEDHQAFAPEAAAPVQLVWLAAHRRHAEFNAVSELSYARLCEEELGAEQVAEFRELLARERLDPDQYLFMPVHPWQWTHKLALVFAPDIAARDLVYLGVSRDRYQAQQSIRTFFNRDQPHKRYVKTALSVLNMGFMRGLSAEYMRDTPAINEWLDQLIRSDAYLASKGFTILREVASVGYKNPYFERAVPRASPYRKMLAALWRESPARELEDGQRLMTMAALLHRDRQGVALLPQLIKASGLSIDAWLDRYLDCYLAPLLHCSMQHDLAFMPHGENLILMLDGNVPTRAFMKDIAEEIVVSNPALPLPERVRRIAIAVPEELRTLEIFTDVFDGILRHLSHILLEQEGYAETRFWSRVGACVTGYLREHPELDDKARRFDLFAPEFRRSCLNRLQLRNNTQMVDLSDPVKNLSFAGTLRNPIACFRP